MNPSTRPLSSLKQTAPQPLSWLWPGRIAAGRLALIDGDPGVGKSLLALDIAARLTNARELPDGYRPAEPASVVFLSGEDDLAQTIVPRFVGAGADLDRVHAWDADSDGRCLFPEACPRLQELIRDTQARLIVIDPLLAFLGAEVSSLNELMILRALEPLAGVAEATGAAFVLIRHLNKESGNTPALYRGLGSITILGKTRTAFLVARDPDDSSRCVFACTKNNLAVLPPALGFRIDGTSAGRPRVEWLGMVPYSADDLVATGRRRGEAVPRALAFLQEQLNRGPCNRQALLEEAGRAGLSLRTLERAKAELGVISKQRRENGRNVWYWELGERGED